MGSGRELRVSAGVWFLGATGDRFVKEELRACFESSDAIEVSRLMRRMLGGE